jgi:hypothetical protein
MHAALLVKKVPDAGTVHVRGMASTALMVMVITNK